MLEQFFQIYKEFQPNDFYVTGEVGTFNFLPMLVYLLSH